MGTLNDLPERIRKKFTVDEGCWLWTAPLDVGGYGRVFVTPRAWKAHRFIYTWLVGPVPWNLELDHLCRVRHCVNPAHLEIVTRKVNQNRGRNANSEKTHCKRGHLLSGDNVYVQRQNGSRSCKVCRKYANEVWKHGRQNVPEAEFTRHRVDE